MALIGELKQLRKHCKKNPELEQYMNDYAHMLNKKHGKSIDSLYLLLTEYNRVKENYK